MTPKTSYNFNYCCRTCLNTTPNRLYSVFTVINHDISIADVINRCISINIEKDDGLPSKICSKCYVSIKSFYEFCVLAEAVDNTYKQQVLSEYHKDIKDSKDISKNGSLENIKKENDNDENYDVGSDNNNIFDVNIKEEYPNTEDVSRPLNTNKNTEAFEILIDSSAMLKFKLKCQMCNKKFSKISSLNQHKKKHDAQKKCYTCNFCLKTYTDHDYFVKHLNTHQDHANSEQCDITRLQNEEQKCEVCLLKFQSKNGLSAHMRRHMNKARILSCKICGKVFSKTSHLKRHELSHSENHPYKCSLCPKTFALESSWKDHVNKHNGIKPHPCPMCSKSFAHVTTLTTHIKIHIKEKPFLCPTCGKRFTANTNLKQHMNRHQGIKMFACNSCPRKFVSKGELKSHIVTHTGERKYACEQCGATFTKRTSLVKHKEGHTGIKPHQCDACPMKFLRKDHLKRHYRIHTGEKPYRCDMCERAFTQSNDLVKHRRAHLGDNVYKCTECSQSFRLHTELRQHLSEHFISKQLQQLDVKTDSNLTVKSEGSDVPKKGGDQSGQRPDS